MSVDFESDVNLQLLNALEEALIHLGGVAQLVELSVGGERHGSIETKLLKVNKSFRNWCRESFVSPFNLVKYVLDEFRR